MYVLKKRPPQVQVSLFSRWAEVLLYCDRRKVSFVQLLKAAKGWKIISVTQYKDIMYQIQCIICFIRSRNVCIMNATWSVTVRYTTGHIWACPPSEGDDYIFHCHPVDQKIPKPKRLQEWYKKMLDKAVSERIVHDYKVSAFIQSL